MLTAKHLPLSIIAYLWTFSPSNVYSLYNGNPSFPMMPEKGVFVSEQAWLGLKTGYECDIIFNRDLKMAKHHSLQSRTVHTYESFVQLGVLTINCADRVEIYSSFGALSSTIANHPFDHAKISYHTDTDFAWSLGGRTILAYWGNTQLGLEASYFQSSPDLQSITVDSHSYPTGDAYIHYWEWQVGAGVSHRYAFFIPYIGLKHSEVRAQFLHLQSLAFLFPKKEFTMKSEGQLGLFLGCGIAPETGFDANVELRLIDETSLTVSADFRF